MNKLLAFLAIAAVCASCSDDDTNPAPQEQSFFTLAEGNKWVYKRYSQGEPNGEYEFTGRVDSVEVVGQQAIEGKNYFVLNHKIYFNANYSEQRDEFLRVDENGHLVDSGGFIKHPGADAEFVYNRTVTTGGGEFEVVNRGEVSYQLLPLQELTVEGSTYSVFPYSGYYTPNDNSSPAGVAHVLNFQQGIGLISERCRYLAYELYYEDRLVHYELN